MNRSRHIATQSGLKFLDAGALPVACCTAFALTMAAYTGMRCYAHNPDVRRERWTLHEDVKFELPEETAAVGQAWKDEHARRHMGLRAGTVSCWSVLGFDRQDAVEEFFPETRG